jgi:YfiR/HmsC-like
MTLGPFVRSLGVSLGLLVLLHPGPVVAAEPMPLAADLQIPLILKVLTYDRHFESKAGRELLIGVVYEQGDPESLKAASTIFETLLRFSGKTVKRLPIRQQLVPMASLTRLVPSMGISVLYVAPGNARNLDAITRFSQESHVTTVTGVPDYVRHGVSVGIDVAQQRPQILINLASSKAEGSEFDASLLRIATIVKK